LAQLSRDGLIDLMLEKQAENVGRTGNPTYAAPPDMGVYHDDYQ
jgi:hypothetical protein